MRARPATKRGSDLGLGCRDSYGRLTYRAVDLGVSVCFYALTALLPALLPITARSARLMSGGPSSGSGRVSLGPST